MKEPETSTRDMFASGDDPPRDPASSPASDAERREWYLAANARHAAGLAVGEYDQPGDVRVDADGVPTAIGPTTRRRTFIAPPVVTSAELARVGLTPADVPNLTIIDIGGSK